MDSRSTGSSATYSDGLLVPSQTLTASESFSYDAPSTASTDGFSSADAISSKKPVKISRRAWQVENIVFRFWRDKITAKRYVKAMSFINSAGVQHLHAPLVSLFKYRGLPVTAHAVIPVDRAELVYSTTGEGDDSTYHDEVEGLVRDLCAVVHVEMPAKDTKEADAIEVVVGGDGRYYVVGATCICPTITWQKANNHPGPPIRDTSFFMSALGVDFQRHDVELATAIKEWIPAKAADVVKRFGEHHHAPQAMHDCGLNFTLAGPLVHYLLSHDSDGTNDAMRDEFIKEAVMDMFTRTLKAVVALDLEARQGSTNRACLSTVNNFFASLASSRPESLIQRYLPSMRKKYLLLQVETGDDDKAAIRVHDVCLALVSNGKKEIMQKLITRLGLEWSGPEATKFLVQLRSSTATRVDYFEGRPNSKQYLQIRNALRNGDLVTAIKVCETWVAQHHETPTSRLRAAYIHAYLKFEEGDADSAIQEIRVCSKEWEKLAGRTFRYTEALALTSHIHSVTGNEAVAREGYLRLVDQLQKILPPDDFSAQRLLVPPLSRLIETAPDAAAIKKFEPLVRHSLLMPLDFADSVNCAIKYGSKMMEYNHYAAAVEILEASEIPTTKVFGDPSLELADVLTSLAFAYQTWDTRKHIARCIELIEKVLAIHRAVHGSLASETAASLNNLGILYLKANRYKPARIAFRESMDIYTKLNKPEHRDELQQVKGNYQRLMNKVRVNAIIRIQQMWRAFQKRREKKGEDVVAARDAAKQEKLRQQEMKSRLEESRREAATRRRVMELETDEANARLEVELEEVRERDELDQQKLEEATSQLEDTQSTERKQISRTERISRRGLDAEEHAGWELLLTQFKKMVREAQLQQRQSCEDDHAAVRQQMIVDAEDEFGALMALCKDQAAALEDELARLALENWERSRDLERKMGEREEGDGRNMMETEENDDWNAIIADEQYDIFFIGLVKVLAVLEEDETNMRALVSGEIMGDWMELSNLERAEHRIVLAQNEYERCTILLDHTQIDESHSREQAMEEEDKLWKRMEIRMKHDVLEEKEREREDNIVQIEKRINNAQNAEASQRWGLQDVENRNRAKIAAMMEQAELDVIAAMQARDIDLVKQEARRVQLRQSEEKEDLARDGIVVQESHERRMMFLKKPTKEPEPARPQPPAKKEQSKPVVEPTPPKEEKPKQPPSRGRSETSKGGIEKGLAREQLEELRSFEKREASERNAVQKDEKNARSELFVEHRSGLRDYAALCRMREKARNQHKARRDDLVNEEVINRRSIEAEESFCTSRILSTLRQQAAKLTHKAYIRRAVKQVTMGTQTDAVGPVTVASPRRPRPLPISPRRRRDSVTDSEANYDGFPIDDELQNALRMEESLLALRGSLINQRSTLRCAEQELEQTTPGPPLVRRGTSAASRVSGRSEASLATRNQLTSPYRGGPPELEETDMDWRAALTGIMQQYSRTPSKQKTTNGRIRPAPGEASLS